ncbi:hypothetical protein Golax_011764 [Gossypium laxum]|uniref:CCHC-type domain-containing protein n=1 Tax=Gossypium laxum TaxID=34288 RepID=A0A7J8ZM44_9ROSI|nr:hypothetical protein [Gossypium laxum]
MVVRFPSVIGTLRRYGSRIEIRIWTQKWRMMLTQHRLSLGKRCFWERDLMTNKEREEGLFSGMDDDFFLLDGDIKRSSVNGIPSIEFSDRVNQILIKNMATSVNLGDYEKVLSQGAWTIFGQYLTVQPWTTDFDPIKPYPSVVMTWIRLPGLPGHKCTKKILWEIGGMVGKVAKLDFNTDSKARGRYASMAIYINLEKPLISMVLINGKDQRIQYESLPVVCFSCGRYGHIKENCGQAKEILENSARKNTTPENGIPETEPAVETDPFGPWMLVERKMRKPSKDPRNFGKNSTAEKVLGSRFRALNNLEKGSGMNVAGKDGFTDSLRKDKNPLIELLQGLEKEKLEVISKKGGPKLSNKVDQAQINKIVSAVKGAGANASGLEPSMQANEFDGIKAHFNATFEGPVGVAVQLSDGVLDPDKHESCFKSTGNSHIPLVESMEVVVILISSKMVNETGNGAQDEVASNLDGVVDSQQ